MNNTFYFFIYGVLLFYTTLLSAQTRHAYTHQQMGTQIGLVFYDVESNRQSPDAIAQLVFDKIDALNEILSNYLLHSEINKLSRQPNVPVEVSEDLYRLLRIASDYSKSTQGAFDITLGSLIEIWKKARKNKQLPSDEEIHAALKKTGYVYLEFPDENSIKLTKEGMLLDVGGIGKGYAADVVINVLKNKGITAALLDMGGDITVSNPPPNKDFWVLGCSYFDENGKEVFQKIKLKNQAIATSGDLYQYAVIDGERYSHIINPNSGIALKNNIQVTTIAPNGAMADAFASALSVLGIAKAKKLIEALPGIEAIMVEDTPSKYKQWQSEGFKEYLIDDNLK